MIVTLAIYSGDAAAALDLLKWINELGGVRHRTILLATTPAVNPAPLIEEAQKGWGNVEHLLIQSREEIQPWPRGNNASFLAVCRHLNERGRAFFWMEADVLPLKSTWLDELEAEYFASGKPFMGVVHEAGTYNGQRFPESLHMNGSGVYPANVMRLLPSLIWLENVHSADPFDMVLRWEVLYRIDGNGGFREDSSGQRLSGCHATSKICFCWRSTNFRFEDRKLVCDVNPKCFENVIDFDRHVLHHGCKDGSLLHLLRLMRRAVSVPTPVVPTPVQTFSSNAPVPEPAKPVEMQIVHEETVAPATHTVGEVKGLNAKVFPTAVTDNNPKQYRDWKPMSETAKARLPFAPPPPAPKAELAYPHIPRDANGMPIIEPLRRTRGPGKKRRRASGKSARNQPQ